MSLRRKLAWLVLGFMAAVVFTISQMARANSVSAAAEETYAPGFKVTILSAGTHETFFYSNCQIMFESNVHKAFEASCSKRKVAHRPFQAQPRTRAYALLVNDMFFYDCELVGAWTGSNAVSGTYHGNRVWHCGGLLPEYSPKREGEP